jgi:hypothetical protein
MKHHPDILRDSVLFLWAITFVLGLYVAGCQQAHAEAVAEVTVTPMVAQSPAKIEVRVKLNALIRGDGCIHVNMPEAGDEDVTTECVPLEGLQVSTIRRTYRLHDAGTYYIWFQLGRNYRTPSVMVELR